MKRLLTGAQTAERSLLGLQSFLTGTHPFAVLALAMLVRLRTDCGSLLAGPVAHGSLVAVEDGSFKWQ